MSEATAYAIVERETGRVVNVVKWDGEGEWLPDIGFAAVPLTEEAGIGWQCDIASGTFAPPAEDRT